MRCEIVAVGTELLLGQIVDTNSAWLGEQLALAGIDRTHGQVVGDNLERIVGALRLALDRSDAVIVCGGLGPTQDDITRDAIAEVMGVPLVTDDEVADRILERFASRGRRMPANNMRQALVPEGATAIADPQPGTAPGLICPVGDKVIYAVPGVPYEMHEIVGRAVLPDLARRAGSVSVIRSRTLRTWGESESGLAERLADHMAELDGAGPGAPTLAFLASGIEGIKVRITVKADDDDTATRLVDAEEKVVRDLVGDIVFGVDDESMEHAVGEAAGGPRPHPGGRRVADRRPGGVAPGQRAQGERLVPGRGGVLCRRREVLAAGRARGAGRHGGGGGGHGQRRPPAARRRRRPGRHRRRRARPDGGPAARHGVPGRGDRRRRPGRAAASRCPATGERVRQFACISLLDMLRRML